MDRKTESIATSISTLDKDIENLKSNQFFGYDTLKLLKAQTANAYDVLLTIPSGLRGYITLRCYNPDFVSVGYNNILFQAWVGNMSTPYYGETSGIGIFSPFQTLNPIGGGDQLDVQAINSGGGGSINLYIKAYAITTMTNAVVTASGYVA